MAMLPDKELRIDPLAMTDVYTEKPPHAKAYTAMLWRRCRRWRALGAEHLASAVAVFLRLLID
jgi:hypothetical protein